MIFGQLLKGAEMVTTSKYTGHQMLTRALVFFSWIAVALILPTAESRAVPAIPNETLITGTVYEYSIVSSRLLNVEPDQVIYRLIIGIESFAGIQNMPNLLREKEGENITVYSKEKLSSDLFGKKVKAKIKLSGDERGHRYWIYCIDTLSGGKNN